MTKDELHALAEEASNATQIKDFVRTFKKIDLHLASLDAEDAKRLRETSMRMMNMTITDRESGAALMKISEWAYTKPVGPKKDMMGGLRDTVSGWFGRR